MDSVVGDFFREEIDGKQYFVYHLDDPGESTMFLCPLAREKQSKNRYLDRHGKKWDDSILLEIDCSPYFNGDIEDKDYFSADYYKRLDFDNHPVIPLFWCNNKKDDSYDNQHCSGCNSTLKDCSDYYFCIKCDLTYHKECIMAPLEIQSPCHPFYSLKLFSSLHYPICILCKNKSCLVYRCTRSNLSIHPLCVLKSIPFSIDQPKRHNHPLTFFTRKASLDCNVCGFIKQMHSTYVCLKCNFVAHQDCADFPSVIRISRHHHRISFTYSLSPGNWSCGVCRKKVDNEYGAYTCKKCDCYVVHSRCALRKDIWDGKELEGIPEEDDIEEVIHPFERISDGLILHFLHKHALKSKTSGEIYDESKICHGCVLPIYEGDFYSCMECDFILHETCANAPRMIRHPLYPHPLTLKVTSEFDNQGYFHCQVCNRMSSGFVYEWFVKNKVHFRLDIRCASISEPFVYQGHEHPLFLALDPLEEQTCQLCKWRKGSLMNCIECDFIRCLECVTLPYMARYIHDKHFLEFGYWEDGNEPDWCEICEKLLFSKKHNIDRRIYRCKECCTALHLECLFGENPYMKPGHTFAIGRNEVQVLSNNSSSRPFCHHCHDRCKRKMLYINQGNPYCGIVHIYGL